MNDLPTTSKIDAESRFQLRTLLETSRMLIESQDPEFVLNNLLLITMGKLLVARGMILICDDENQNYTVTRSKGRDLPEEGTSLNIKCDPDNLETACIPLKESEITFPENWPVSPEGLLFNLRTTNQHIGFLYLGPKANNKPLTDIEREFTESLVIISSVAIANSRMFDELRLTNRRLDRKVHDLNTLLELSEDFNLMVDETEIASTFKFAMLGQMLIRTFIFAIKDEEGVIKIISQNGISEPPSAEELHTLFEIEEDEYQCSSNESIDFLIKENIQLVLALKFQNKKTAIVGVGPKATKKSYDSSDVNYLHSLGNLALLSIQKTRLLKEQLEKRRMEEELNLAKDIQKGLLPNPLPIPDGFDLSAVNISSRQVGGDYYEILQTEDGGYLIGIADVTGKGVPASLLMANLQSMIHALSPLDITLSEATSRINDIIYNNTPNDKFITFFWGKLDADGTSFRYVNAGHNPPYLLRAENDEPEELTAGGVILGAVPSMTPYEDDLIKFTSGDLLVMFTDGVTESMNPDQTEEYAEERLISCIKKNRTKNAEDIMNAIIDDINKFSEHTQYDDITMIVMKAN